MMDLVERKDTKEERKVPKNVRQIGEPGAGTRIYIEDYAYTYLHQLAEANLTCMKTASLVGHAEEGSRIYIQGALELEMGREIRGWFSNEHWRKIFQAIQDWYEGMDVVGWFLSNPGFPPIWTEFFRRTVCVLSDGYPGWGRNVLCRGPDLAFAIGRLLYLL